MDRETNDVPRNGSLLINENDVTAFASALEYEKMDTDNSNLDVSKNQLNVDLNTWYNSVRGPVEDERLLDSIKRLVNSVIATIINDNERSFDNLQLEMMVIES